jgi:hypothetical protein
MQEITGGERAMTRDGWGTFAVLLALVTLLIINTCLRIMLEASE